MKITISGNYIWSKQANEGVRLDVAMSRLGRTDTGGEILPDGIRFINGKRLVFELEPGVRNVDIEWKDHISRQHRIAFPYLVFYYHHDDGYHRPVYVFFRNQPLRSLDDELYVPALPNCLHCGRGMHYACGTGGSGNLCRLANVLRTGFFSQRFNLDSYGSSGHYQYLHSLSKTRRLFCKIRDPVAWERASLKNPEFILKMDWIKTKHTPRSLLANDMKEPVQIMSRMANVIYYGRPNHHRNMAGQRRLQMPQG